ncbi:uncharacterized protein [Neodiprion pinetum]|uniref:uncharacterized protein n=1 Tax=Neodiprion pinetum TaxID=441929 RepID=UPI003723543D
MWTWFSMQRSYTWLDISPDLVSAYNAKHQTIRVKPLDVTVLNERLLLRQATTEIFTMSRVENIHLVTYKLKDYRDQPIAGGFYEQELLKAEHPDIYLVEKVLKKRRRKVYVKWLDFDNTHNSGINKSVM